MPIHIEIDRGGEEPEKIELRHKGQHIQFPSETFERGVKDRFFVVVRSLGQNAGAEVYHIDPSHIPNPSNPRGRISPYVFGLDGPVRHVVPGEAWNEVIVDAEGQHQMRIGSDPYDLSG